MSKKISFSMLTICRYSYLVVQRTSQGGFRVNIEEWLLGSKIGKLVFCTDLLTLLFIYDVVKSFMKKLSYPNFLFFFRKNFVLQWCPSALLLVKGWKYHIFGIFCRETHSRYAYYKGEKNIKTFRKVFWVKISYRFILKEICNAHRAWINDIKESTELKPIWSDSL